MFPNLTVEAHLLMGGYLLPPLQARAAAIRRACFRAASAACSRSRALVMQPEVLLIDEPSIGLEPRFIDKVFAILAELQHEEDKTIVMVEQNAKKGLEFADLGYVLVSDELALAGSGANLLRNPQVGHLFLGG